VILKLYHSSSTGLWLFPQGCERHARREKSSEICTYKGRRLSSIENRMRTWVWEAC